MKWQGYLIAIGALLAVLGVQIATAPPLLIGVVGGIFLVLLGSHRHWSPVLWVGALMVSLSVLVNPVAWLILFVVLVLAVRFAGTSSGNVWPWAKKQFIAVSADASAPKAGQTKRYSLFGPTTIGQTVYAWDDLNLIVGAGDTIIDLDNTLLPAGENVVMLRKGFGKTRLLVPVGVAIHLDVTAGIGTTMVDGKQYRLRQERIQHYSKDYDQAPRKLHLLVNVLVGDVEVVSV